MAPDPPTGFHQSHRGGTEEVPAFPLGNVLLPGQLMELRVFEPRYRVMLFDLRDRRPAEFLVTMIERGSEVGGGDVRASVGCMATVLRSVDTDDNQTLLSIVGTDRTHVIEWLPEDPYPRALVSRVTATGDATTGTAPDGATPDETIRDLTASAERVLALARRLGQPGAEEVPDWDPDPVVAVWQIALATPLATLDRYRLLAQDDLLERLSMLGSMLGDTAQMLQTWTEPPRNDD